MRLVISALAALCLSAPALAGPGSDLAEMAAQLRTEAEARADTFTAMPGANLPPISADDPFLVDVADFAAGAARLAHTVETAGGPQDLRCIFRGMSSDAEARISDLEAGQSGADLARIYRAYARLFAQAEEIAPLADDPDVSEGEGVAPSCPALPLD